MRVESGRAGGSLDFPPPLSPPAPLSDPDPTADPATTRILPVVLAGAGPGDAGLLTVRADRALCEADLILADALVSPEIMAALPAYTETVQRSHAPGDPPGSRESGQRAMIDRMIREAKAGRKVVRLKGGDPSIFGRGHEEADALLAAGVPVEIVPGVTAASAAAAYAGVPLTHRDHASAVCFVTGHEADKRGGSAVDWSALAAFPGTRVFYMARARLGRVCGALLTAGLDPATPAALVSRAALPDQRTLTATAATIAGAADAADLPGPAVLLVGPAATDPGDRGWWERRPLHGVTVAAVNAGRIGEIEERLDAAGATFFDIELLSTPHVPAPAGLAEALDDLRPGDALAFTSRSGVAGFGIWYRARGQRDIRELAGIRIACVGPGTADSLRYQRLHADLVPAVHDGEHLAAALAPHVAGKRVLWPTCPEARSTLADRLTEAGADVRRVHVYRQRPATELRADFRAKLDAGQVDWAMVGSGNLAKTFAELSAGSPGLGRVKVAAISENVAAACREAGLTVGAVAAEATWDGLVDAVVRAVGAGAGGGSS